MLNTDEFLALENKWKKYKIMYFSRYILFAISACLILILLLSFSGVFSKNDISITIIQDNTTENISIITDAQINASVPPKTIAPKETQNLVVLSMDDFSALLANVSSANLKKQNDKFIENKVEKNIEKTPVNQIEVKTEEPVKNKILIETNEIQNIESLQKRYYITNNIVFATMLSEEYYEMKNYNSSLKWALEANEKDPQSELSWIMFAKSKYRLGQKEEAINALKIFLKHKKSPAAASLLKQISNNDLFD